jgi:hypothetical protein
LRNAFIKAVAADPNITPLNFFLIAMRQSSQPMTVRVSAAQQALPYLHVKLPPAKAAPLRSSPRLQLRRKFDIGLKDLDFDFEWEDAGDDESDGVMAQASVIESREGGGQLGQVEVTVEHQVPAPALDQSTAEATAANDAAATPSLQPATPDTGNETAKRADDQRRKAEAKALTPLQFLHAVLRHPDTPPPLRMKVASILMPYSHGRAAPAEEKPEFAIDDQYGFEVDPEVARKLRDGKKALDALPRSGTTSEGSDKRRRDALTQDLAEAKKLLHCPEGYRWKDLKMDQTRLLELAEIRKVQGLSPEEDAEEIHLTARALSHENSAEHAERESENAKLERLERRRSELCKKWERYEISPDEQKEFDSLRAILRPTDRKKTWFGALDPVERHFSQQLRREAWYRGLPEPTTEEIDKLWAEQDSSKDIVRYGPPEPEALPDDPRDLDLAAWLRGEVRYELWRLHKAAYAIYGKYSTLPIYPDLVVALVREQKVVPKRELCPYFAWYLMLYDEGVKNGRSPSAYGEKVAREWNEQSARMRDRFTNASERIRTTNTRA